MVNTGESSQKIEKQYLTDAARIERNRQMKIEVRENLDELSILD